MIQYVRVTATPVAADSSLLPMLLDLVIDGSGNIQGDWAILGLQGSVNHPMSRSAPFVLYSDGVVDYGDEATDGRYAKMEIRDESIIVGRPLLLNYKDRIQTYRITAIRPIVEGS